MSFWVCQRGGIHIQSDLPRAGGVVSRQWIVKFTHEHKGVYVGMLEVLTVLDSKSQQKILMMYFCSKHKINTTLLFAKFDSWPTLKLGLIN